MGIITAKQLKQKTGEIIKKVKSGERLTVTYRGKPVAIIAPPTKQGLPWRCLNGGGRTETYAFHFNNGYLG